MELSVVLVNPDFDAEELDNAATSLRLELADADADVHDLPAGAAPEGTRAIDAATIGGLAVSVSGGLTVLREVLTMIATWRQRGQGSAVRLKLGDDEIELSEATSADQERILEAFLDRQRASAPTPAAPTPAAPALAPAQQSPAQQSPAQQAPADHGSA